MGRCGWSTGCSPPTRFILCGSESGGARVRGWARSSAVGWSFLAGQMLLGGILVLAYCSQLVTGIDLDCIRTSPVSWLHLVREKASAACDPAAWLDRTGPCAGVRRTSQPPVFACVTVARLNRGSSPECRCSPSPCAVVHCDDSHPSLHSSSDRGKVWLGLSSRRSKTLSLSGPRAPASHPLSISHRKGALPCLPVFLISK